MIFGSTMQINLQEYVSGCDYKQGYLLHSGSPQCHAQWELGEVTTNKSIIRIFTGIKTAYFDYLYFNCNQTSILPGGRSLLIPPGFS